MQRSIEHKWQYSHSPERVWEYLTKPELIAQWLMENNLRPVVGHQFEFRTKPLPALDFDGIVYCTVLEVVPFQKLSYSWKGGPGGGKITLDSIVVWTLQEKDNGTELHLMHTGFKEMENYTMYTAMDAGWLKNMGKIADLLNVATHGTAST